MQILACIINAIPYVVNPIFKEEERALQQW